MSDKRPISEVLREACDRKSTYYGGVPTGTAIDAHAALFERYPELLAIVEAAKDVVAWPLKQDEPMEHADGRLRDALQAAGEEPTR